MNLVSVVVPAFNSAKYLSRCIQSALLQTYAPLEIIVVDDGSTDHTESVVRSFGKRIKYLRKQNGGPASARNLGIQHAVGDYIAFLDADDYWLPHKIKTQMDFFHQYPHYGLVHANTFINEPGKQLYPAFVNMRIPTGMIFADLFKDNLINNSTVMAKRSCIDEINGFDESRKLIGIEDYELWLRLAVNNRIGYIHQIVAVYNVHGNNISDERKAIQSQLYLIRKFIKTYDWIEDAYPGLLQEKLERVSFRYACLLMQKENYKQAQALFGMTIKRACFRTSSIAGISTSILKTNILFKDRVTSLRCKHYGNFLLKLGRRQEALTYYMKAFRLFPLQKSLYQSIAKLI